MDLKVAYIYDYRLKVACNSIPVVTYRASYVHELIKAYDLLKSMMCLKSNPATEEDIRQFHSQTYTDYLKKADSEDCLPTDAEDTFGLDFDCPRLQNLWSIARILAGGSLTAAKAITMGTADVAINWCGGWHHARMDSASGFCYVNDIVLTIQQLRKKFNRVLYIDLDVHHGDGVEYAFSFSSSVLTVSIHMKESAFFPGTGGTDDVGKGNGKLYALNVPYKAGLRDAPFVQLVKTIVKRVQRSFSPGAMVVQCGADALAFDRLGGACLSLGGYCEAFEAVMSLNLPTVVLGGGGYNRQNSAKLWTSLTASLVQRSLDNEIPEHAYFQRYGPSFELEIDEPNRKDENTEEEITSLVQHINDHFDKMDALSLATFAEANQEDSSKLKETKKPCYMKTLKRKAGPSQGSKSEDYAFSDSDTSSPEEGTEEEGGSSSDQSSHGLWKAADGTIFPEEAKEFEPILKDNIIRNWHLNSLSIKNRNDYPNKKMKSTNHLIDEESFKKLLELKHRGGQLSDIQNMVDKVEKSPDTIKEDSTNIDPNNFKENTMLKMLWDEHVGIKN